MTSTAVEPDDLDDARDPEEAGTEQAPALTGRSRWHRAWRGREDDPVWVRPSVVVLLAGTAVLYMWGLGASGWANSFYSAAVQAGTKSWKAFFFGSSDASNFITVDKPPAALWVMDISARIFGVNSWSILVPQALEGVAAVGVLYATVRRWFSAGAGLLAGAILALTPVAALMFRFNNPDALLTLLLVVGAYAVTRALEQEAGSTKWLMIAAACVGFGFLTKMLQALTVVPAFALVYLVAGPPKLGKRLWQLLLAGVTLVVSAGWWVAAVELWPKGSRPYIGGSTNNSVLDLVFGYNGFGRLTGNERGSVGGRGNGTGQWGPTGWLRMFNSSYGGQASWLLPAALVLLIAGLAATWRAPRTDRTRAALILWGAWLFVTAAVFSLSKGIIHEYYTVALAPAIGAVIAIGAWTFWTTRSAIASRVVLAAALGVTVWWSARLLDRTPSWNPRLHTLVVVAGIAAVVLLLAGELLHRRLGLVAVMAAVVAALAGPTAFAVTTAGRAEAGAIPLAGPVSGPGGRGGPGQGLPPFFPRNRTFPGNVVGNGPPPSGLPGRGPGGPNNGPGRGPASRRGPGGLGGLLNGSMPSAEMTAALRQDAATYRWVLATIGANQAAGYQLATGDPVMAIGGFNGTDPTPTFAEFQAYVNAGQIHYFIEGGTGGTSPSANQIVDWVTSTFNTVRIGGVTVYDLTSPAF